jgi:syntaxin 5
MHYVNLILSSLGYDNFRVSHDRIDENMDGTLVNVEGAHGQLLKHLNNISSSMWMMSKIFILLIIFLLIFVLFV